MPKHYSLLTVAQKAINQSFQNSSLSPIFYKPLACTFHTMTGTTVTIVTDAFDRTHYAQFILQHVFLSTEIASVHQPGRIIPIKCSMINLYERNFFSSHNHGNRIVLNSSFVCIVFSSYIRLTSTAQKSVII